jgi:spermidine synthase
VVIVGTGTGNDVAAALRAGVGEIDAVEIDPAIVSFGREHHPEDPTRVPGFG